MENNKADRCKQLAFVHKVIFDMRLTTNQLVIYFFIVAHVNPRTQEAFPGVRKIANKLKMNKNTVFGAIGRLEKLKLIKKAQKNRGTAVVYRITNYRDWRFAGALVSDENERAKSVPVLLPSVPEGVPGKTEPLMYNGSNKEVVRGSVCPIRSTKKQLVDFAQSRDFPASDGAHIFERLEARAWRIGGSQIKDAFAYFREQETAQYLPSQKRKALATKHQSIGNRYGVG